MINWAKQTSPSSTTVGADCLMMSAENDINIQCFGILYIQHWSWRWPLLERNRFGQSHALHQLPYQVHRPVPTSDHASHVVWRRLPLDQGERGTGAALWSSHPHRGTTLLLLRCHPRHHDHVLHSHQTGEQEHSRLGQWVIHISITSMSRRFTKRNLQCSYSVHLFSL